jgi:hypothetical protein
LPKAGITPLRGVLSLHTNKFVSVLGIRFAHSRNSYALCKVRVTNMNFLNMSTQNHKKLLFLCTGNYYRSRFAERFPQWLDVVEYWKVHDVDKTFPPVALQQIVKNIHHLLLDIN